jgi:YidC/Oxa1 family membrane protein insertase
MNETNRNVLIAMVLSMVVLVGWQFFVSGPQMERAQRQAEIAAAQNAAADPGLATAPSLPATDAATGAGSVPATTAIPTSFADRASAIAATPRVTIDTASVVGSINLRGARLDDLQLKRYTETIAEDSPIITLLTPSGAPNAYYAEQGLAVADGSTIAVPDATTVWTVEGNDKLTETTPVTLAWDNGAGIVFRRTFAIDANYLFTVTQGIENNSGAPVQLYPYARAVREGTPHVANFFIQHEGPLGVLGSNNLVLRKYSDLHGDTRQQFLNTTGWVGFGDKYWATAVIAEPGKQINAQLTYLKPANREEYQTSYVGTEAISVAPGATAESKSYVFAGAKEEHVLASYQNEVGIDRLDMMIDWGWFSFLTYPMFWLLRALNGVLGNFGVAVLVLTVIVKLIFFPLASRSYASMAAMRRVAPEMKSIQERYKEDRPAQQKAMMELYKREKINPLSGCWPVLIQIPVFFALYTVIFITIDMRHAPFFGWIQDLAAQDPTNVFTLFGLIPWNPTAMPIIGGLLHLGIWPIIMGITMWVQMRLNPPPPDPTQAAIFNWMPVVFTFMLGTFPAGLVIYWSWNNFLSILQQYFIMKRHGVDVDLFGNILTSLGLRKPAKTS